MLDELGEEENAGSMMMDTTTGKYFDEGGMEDFIDIVPEDEEEAKKAKRSKGWNKVTGIKSSAAVKPKGGKFKNQ